MASTPDGSPENELVVRGWGQDRPGIAEAFMQVVLDNNCEVKDIAQFVLEGSLLFTFVIRASEQSSMSLMRELTRVAKELKLKLDFYFPEADDMEDLSEKNMAVLSIVSGKDITPALLSDIDGILAEHGCVTIDITQRDDNRRAVNGEYNKVELRVNCPIRLKFATLMIGAPEGSTNGTTKKGMQKVAWENDAEVSIRWWNAMNRPNGKSLVIFGSAELCTCEVLDELLKEAKVDTSGVDVNASRKNQREAKAALLKGVPTSSLQKVIDGVEFTPGSRLVCAALKRLGFRLALVSDADVKKVGDHIAQELGIDYVLSKDLQVVDGCFTGEFTGEKDIAFRKADLLKLMAEREGVDYHNVIVIGRESTTLSPPRARELMDTFGPIVHCTPGMPLTSVLYLLGFNGMDVLELKKRRAGADDGECASPVPSMQSHQVIGENTEGKRFRVQISSRHRRAGQLQQLLSPVSSHLDLRICNVSQCSLQDGGMCLGLEFSTQNEDPEELVKEILFVCQQNDLQALSSSFDVEARSLTAAVSDRSYVITVVQSPSIKAASLHGIFTHFGKSGVNILRFERLSSKDFAAMQFMVQLPLEVETEAFTKQLVEISQSFDIDITFQKDDLDRWMRRMVVFDMDSTLIQQEVIDELARYAGVEAEVSAITEAAMRGDLNFFESLKSRVALLKGHNADELFGKAKANLIYTPGAKELCTTLKLLGFKMAVISGGFLPVAREVQKYLGLDYAFANTLDVDEATGNLTGKTSGPVVTPQRKKQLLATIADVEGCQIQQTIAVGDGANDIPMLHTAGLGIAFCAKPKVQAVTEVRINQKDLRNVLYLIGVSEAAAKRLQHD